MSKYRFEFRAMTVDDREELATLVAECYQSRETITKHIGESFEQCFENYAKPVVYSVMPNLSFVCIDHFGKNGNEIIGCLLCSKVEVEQIQYDEPMNASKAFEILNNEFKQRFLALHKDDEVKDYLSKECACLKDEYAEKGIATKLCYLVLSNAKQLGYGFALMMPTVNEAKHLATKKLKAKKLFGICYEDFEYNGVQYFKGITDPKTYDAYEVALADFDSDRHRVELKFD
ncbi:hypothetical protein B4U80_14053 [Leptotrombidium deliense]|uniref:N-acetyltransferase domain-containing protein n=1 Tax=Leptotrombidium deliense TaxID=299467 RepID=A0A443S3Y8_9ACAR|nr:hypothetical protein B4U80_14053 [Leptotrombidium deliense]